MPSQAQDLELVGRFLADVATLSNDEVGRRVPGVSHSDASRWRREKWSRLSAAKRRALEAWLARERDPSPELLRASVLLAAELLEDTARDLRARVDGDAGERLRARLERIRRELGDLK